MRAYVSAIVNITTGVVGILYSGTIATMCVRAFIDGPVVVTPRTVAILLCAAVCSIGPFVLAIVVGCYMWGDARLASAVRRPFGCDR